MKRICLLFVAAFLTACALPETSVKTGNPRPAIYVQGAPQDTLLFIDGLLMGASGDFNGAPKTLLVEEGVHLVEIRRGNAVLHTEKVFVSKGESRLISVNTGNEK
jgi:hypothetical protein